MSIESDPSGHSVLLDAETFKPDTLMAEEIFAAEQEGMVPDELSVPSAPEQAGSADQSSHIYNANSDGVVGDEQAGANFQGGRQGDSQLTQSARRGGRNLSPADVANISVPICELFLPALCLFQLGAQLTAHAQVPEIDIRQSC